jgi:transcriptional regulator with XRE-family HTH domain
MSTDGGNAATSLSDQIAEEILSLMGRRRINKAELARRLGQKQDWIGRRLNGRQPFDVEDLQRIAVILGVDAVDLLPRKQGESVPKRSRSLESRVIATVGQDPGNRSDARRSVRTGRKHHPGRAVSATRPLVPLDRGHVATLSAR